MVSSPMHAFFATPRPPAETIALVEVDDASVVEDAEYEPAELAPVPVIAFAPIASVILAGEK